eukprot:4406256-Prymnesium_polylepis.1
MKPSHTRVVEGNAAVPAAFGPLGVCGLNVGVLADLDAPHLLVATAAAASQVWIHARGATC